MIKLVPRLLLFIALLPLCAQAQDSLQKKEDEKKVIRLLLKERKDRFAQYTEHLDDKSGFFGNQTKKDLKQINEVLMDIVRTDNNIIMELDRLLDQKKFENFRSDYETKRAGQELVTLQEQNERLMAANDTLNKQLETVHARGDEQHGSRTIYIFLTYFFGAALVFLLLLTKRSNARAGTRK
jgi:preprotein translocase subunit SecG